MNNINFSRCNSFNYTGFFAFYQLLLLITRLSPVNIAKPDYKALSV
ncbi:hypothetical protein H6G06_02800 [Anabaena sphaerica FACHB-251]|uniref:Uncharacterized protein n=1 Tax=Anabaena sphaerica FACHB-251 TaxID=2692883 RepID=A0A926WFC3_9NOST|nr:hypothetical protein [Anabaena sphaerica]MBD2292436.1 hypothetical protein [Anabaena sphaerica FACHB-251]